MELFKGVAKGHRVPPRKARLVADLIRGLSVKDAENQLLFCNMKSGRFMKKLLDSVVANAASRANLLREQLSVIEVKIDEGPSLKRAKSKSRGGRAPILKRTSHFTVVLGAKGQLGEE
ncbi:50S ribosomal protein L22 [Candidatus Clavichlamydia salmonicola]|uniref:50S ribosomal protein L22 n=1 Tax=Candidatus Clavichlamydia salmonicola TaxID=469812 RepID=UPI0018915AE6|nr:50S ribosomal protein L22 [Candidatus Clavichlamydia salmonicola]MBF5050752.1 50S ribosomal protein L22 [Candidatus Clavichlamydia salmonicola]